MDHQLDAIFFDIDDTLYSTSEFAKVARLNSVHAMIKAGLRMSTADCLRELNDIIEEFGSNFSKHYDNLLLRISPETYSGVNPAIIVAAGAVAYHETKFKNLRPYEDVLEVFQLLSHTNLLIGIITAGLEIKQAEKLIRLKLLEYINPQAIFITEQVGIGKPNFKLYQNACTTLGLAPQGCIYVGDNPVNDIDPPNEIGMITVLNRRSGKYLDIKGKSEPDYLIHDMWELWEILRRDFKVTASQ